MKVYFLRLLYILLILTACKAKTKNTPEDFLNKLTNKQNFNVGKHKYTVNVPDGWTTKNSTHSGIDYFFLIAPRTEPNSNTSINFITENMAGFDLDTYTSLAKKNLKNDIPSVNFLESGSLNNGTQSNWYSYTFTFDQNEVFCLTYIFAKDGIAYVMTNATHKKDSSLYRSTFEEVAKSFRFED